MPVSNVVSFETARPKFEMPRVLWVDDHEDTTGVMGTFLLQAGFVVQTASGCDEARKQIEGDFFHLYVIDNVLPDGIGVDLIGDIRAQDPTTPIILMAAQVRSEVQEQAMRRGAQCYVLKPVNPEVFVTIVRRQIENAFGPKARPEGEGRAIVELAAEKMRRSQHALHSARKSVRRTTEARFANRDGSGPLPPGKRVRWKTQSDGGKSVSGEIRRIVSSDMNMENFDLYEVRFDFGLLTLHGSELEPE
jgi:DNA-binding response OmpR family regulator